jgi:FAD dependent oxidoreductase TIGR03364
MALRSRAHWLELARAAGIWHEAAGSLHIARNDDEAAVLEEFAASEEPGDCILLTPAEAAGRCPPIRREGLVSALWSGTEVCVDPREAVAELPGYLERAFGVEFRFGAAVARIALPEVEAGGVIYRANRVFVCAGDDLGALYPSALGQAGLYRCKLQMMRSARLGGIARLGPMIAGGLTLRHYASFRQRVASERPLMDRYGIHVMASQNGKGELTIGDSHEYGAEISPFDKPEIDRLILGYLSELLDLPGLEIAERWHGTYCKHPTEPYVVLEPEPGVTLVTGVGGAGMTLSFGLAEQVIYTEANP